MRILNEAEEQSRFRGKGGGSGPAKGNANAQRHGMKGSKLPPDCKYIELRVNKLRREVEATVIEAKGKITIVDAAAINGVLRWETARMLAAHWLRREAAVMSLSDRLRCSEGMAKAGDMRDKNLRSLGLDRDKADDLFESLYGRPKPKLIENHDAAGGTDER